MKAYRIEVEMPEDKQLNLDDLPFKKGVKVEVIVSEVKREADNKYPLRNSLVKYELPFAAATDSEDWEVVE